VQTVGDKGPELGPPAGPPGPGTGDGAGKPQPETAPPPRAVTPAVPEGGIGIGQPIVGDGPLGPQVGHPVDGMPGHAAGPIAGPLAGPPHPRHTPFGFGHAPTEFKKIALPRYVIAPPDILTIDSLEAPLTQPVRGPHLVRPDGTVGLGAYGEAYVAGLTLEQAKVEIAKVIHSRLNPAAKSLKDVLDGLSIDVVAYNSRVYYVITNRLGFGQIVTRLPITGNETVMDALSQIQGIPPEATGHRIWVARKVPGHGGQDNKLNVDWVGVSQRGEMRTNYQMLPGDRLYVQAEALQRGDYWLSKFLAPINRVFGSMLLSSQTINSIQSGGIGR
jgi:polysaccharide export outer membrane protein